MALERKGTAFVFGPEADGAGTPGFGIISTNRQKRYGSEVEITGPDGELIDVVYSGAEETITTTEYTQATTVDATAMGDGNLNTDGVLTRVSLQLSNEDMAKVEKERLRIEL
jgi:hypothetical protein